MSLRVQGFPMRRTDVVLVDDGVDSLLSVPEQGATHLLNPTARAIWELCDGQTHPDEMIDAICQLFSVLRQAAEQDVQYALERLTSAGLVRWESNRGGSVG